MNYQVILKENELLKAQIAELQIKNQYFLQQQEEITSERERLSVTLRSIGDGVCTLDMMGKITMMNGIAEIMAGWQQHEAIGKFFDEVFVIQDEQSGRKRSQPVMEVMDSEYSTRTLNRWILTSRNGRQRYVEDYASPIKNKQGWVIGLIVVLHDVTRSCQAEKQIESERSRLNSILDGINESFYVSDPVTYDMLYANRVLREQYGNVDGQKCYITLKGRVTPCTTCSNHEIFGENEGKTHEWECYNELLHRWYRCIIRAIRWPDNRMVRCQLSIDITDRKLSEQALRESEDKFTQFMNSLPLMAFIKDQDGRYLYLNRASEEIIGDTKWQGKTSAEYFGQEIGSALARGDREVQSKGLFTDVVTIPSPDGILHTLEIHKFNIPKTGKKSVIGGFAIDITVKKRMEEIQQLIATRLETLVRLSSMTDSSVTDIADFALEEGVRLTRSAIGYLGFIDTKQKILKVYAWSKSVMKDCMMREKSVDFYIPDTKLLLEAARNRTAFITNDYQNAPEAKSGYPEGHFPISRYMSVPIMDGNHDIVLLAGVANKAEPYDEIDAQQLTLLMQGVWQHICQRNAKENQEKLIEELQHYIREIELFKDIVTHDLMAPLRSIKLNIELFEYTYKRRLDQKADVLIGQISESSVLLSGLIEAIKHYSDIGTQSMSIEPLDFNNLIEQVKGVLSIAIEHSGAVIEHHDLPVLMADRYQMIQLFQNLINNAIKFRRESPPRINISAEQRDGCCVFSVRDNGIGIAPEHSERIFRIFQQLKTKMDCEGKGIGLAVCKKIVERHGGRIWLESTNSIGAEFRFSLPVLGDETD